MCDTELDIEFPDYLFGYDQLNWDIEGFLKTMRFNTKNEKFMKYVNEITALYESELANLDAMFNASRDLLLQMIPGQGTAWHLEMKPYIDELISKCEKKHLFAKLNVRSVACEKIQEHYTLHMGRIDSKRYGEKVFETYSEYQKTYVGIDTPYPLISEKLYLASVANISKAKLDEWFGNKRTRVVKRNETKTKVYLRYSRVLEVQGRLRRQRVLESLGVDHLMLIDENDNSDETVEQISLPPVSRNSRSIVTKEQIAAEIEEEEEELGEEFGEEEMDEEEMDEEEVYEEEEEEVYEHERYEEHESPKRVKMNNHQTISTTIPISSERLSQPSPSLFSPQLSLSLTSGSPTSIFSTDIEMNSIHNQVGELALLPGLYSDQEDLSYSESTHVDSNESEIDLNEIYQQQFGDDITNINTTTVINNRNNNYNYNNNYITNNNNNNNITTVTNNRNNNYNNNYIYITNNNNNNTTTVTNNRDNNVHNNYSSNNNYNNNNITTVTNNRDNNVNNNVYIPQEFLPSNGDAPNFFQSPQLVDNDPFNFLQNNEDYYSFSPFNL